MNSCKLSCIYCRLNGNYLYRNGETSGTIARIEVNPDEITKLVQNREAIVSEFKKIGFNYVSMDLQGYRTGSMNETIKTK